MKMKKKQSVNEFMSALDHPLKEEMEAVRRIILGVHPGITEQIKWAGPCFTYQDYLVTFNPRAKNHVHLVFHNGAVLHDSTGLLEGNYIDRRMAYFRNMDEVNAKQPALESVVREWIRIMDQK
jgi:hypothetical protein